MLAINEEFVSIQGEGVFTGTKMYFVRLQGCEVGCHFCDTKQSWRKTVNEDDLISEKEIIDRVVKSNISTICVTGGEPLEQDLRKLLALAKMSGLRVHVETSGSNFHDWLIQFNWITVSPKFLFSKKQFDESFLRYANEFKCVVTQESDIVAYQELLQNYKGTKIFQPVNNDKSIAKWILERTDVDEWLVMCQQQKILELR